MGFIRIYERSDPKRVKKKPGWQQAEAEHAEWLARVSAQTFSSRAPRLVRKQVDPIVRQPVVRSVELPASRVTPGGSAGKPLATPEVLYRDNEELLERERQARARKFNVAPAYNKGADQLVTEDELRAVLSTNRRR